MTENSRFWDGTTVGDATEAPYNAPDEFAAVLRSLNGANANTSRSGVCRGELNLLACTGAASPISVNTGRAFVHGSWYESDASVSFNIATPPATQSRIDTLVLRKTWSTQQVRLAVLTGTNAVVPSAPTLTQDATVLKIWEFPLYDIYINSAGVITSLVDRREYVPYLSSQYFDKITETTLAVSAASVTLPIGGTSYRAIIAVLDTCSSGGSGVNAIPIFMYFNTGDPNNYYTDYFYSFSGAQWSEENNTWGIYVGNAIRQAVLANSRSSSFIVLTGLKESGVHKSVLILGNWAYATFSGSLFVGSGQYLGTPVVTSITFTLDDTGSPLFEVGSRFTLYGVL